MAWLEGQVVWSSMVGWSRQPSQPTTPDHTLQTQVFSPLILFFVFHLNDPGLSSDRSSSRYHAPQYRIYFHSPTTTTVAKTLLLKNLFTSHRPRPVLIFYFCASLVSIAIFFGCSSHVTATLISNYTLLSAQGSPTNFVLASEAGALNDISLQGESSHFQRDFPQTYFF